MTLKEGGVVTVGTNGATTFHDDDFLRRLDQTQLTQRFDHRAMPLFDHAGLFCHEAHLPLPVTVDEMLYHTRMVARGRKRALRDQQVAADRAKAVVVGQLLTVLDDLDRARAHGDLESGPLKSVADKLTAALTGLGLTAFGAEGDEFDPSLHEAVQHEGDGSKPVIGTVMRQGYKLGDQVLRHALVGVVDTVDDASAESDTPTNGEQSGSQNAESDS